MRNLCHHKFKKLLMVIPLSIVELGFDPRHTDSKYISKYIFVLCCYDIKSPEFKPSKKHDMPRQKCSIATAGNNDMCGANLIYPLPTA